MCTRGRRRSVVCALITGAAIVSIHFLAGVSGQQLARSARYSLGFQDHL